ncbi:protein VAPYRIN-like [Cryptomeria japonica]|uniref:protein VAPYRIN-like n=1 Tax=Cryptomeria japonica TaxID=3369 RepID=UPI0027D9D267|nr:protein VAPYRIN-like [Cryptomeria japonica]
MAVISGDADLLGKLAEDPGLINIIEKKDENGDTALHLAVRIDRVELVRILVKLDVNLCDSVNNEGESPLKVAVRLGFKDALEHLVPYTLNALHYIVELNQVRLVEYLIRMSKENKLDLSKLKNQPYQPTTKPQHVQRIGGGEQHPTNASGFCRRVQRGRKPRLKKKKPQIRPGDTPLHIAARNKYEDMVYLLLKVRGVNNLVRNSEHKTPFEIAREVTEYHESFWTIRKLGDFAGRSKPFMYCAPQVSHKKYKKARLMETKPTKRDAMQNWLWQRFWRP